LLITGTDKFFSNGLDLAWAQGQSNTTVGLIELVDVVLKLLARILIFPLPTVAVINGHAFGAGFFLAMVCDWRVMRDDKGFICTPEVDIRLPFGNFRHLLHAKLDKRAQRDTALTGKRWKAKEAFEVGILDAVVDPGTLITVGKQLAVPALGKDRAVYQAIKKDLWGTCYDGLLKVPSKL